MNATEIWTVVGALGGASGVALLGQFFISPIKRLSKDLAPLTERNSDGESVFDEMRKQQKEDSTTLQHLADEFPKNGVPTRATVDALKLMVSEIKTSQHAIDVALAEVKASQAAHVKLHTQGRR